MKNVLTLALVLLISLGLKAQEKNGTVFNKHPAIDNTKKFLAAFEKGDKEALGAFLADSMVAIYNGSGKPQNREFYLKTLDWWSTEFENLKVVDDAPAFPDAIEYSKGGVWVQDWLLITGTHKKSGINLKLHMHDLYQLNKAGKIASLHFYFNSNFYLIKVLYQKCISGIFLLFNKQNILLFDVKFVSISQLLYCIFLPYILGV